MKKKQKLNLIAEAIEIFLNEKRNSDELLFFCTDTKICEIKEVYDWINVYKKDSFCYAFDHNPFTGVSICGDDSPIEKYNLEKLDILYEIQRRIINDEELTVHVNCKKD